MSQEIKQAVAEGIKESLKEIGELQIAAEQKGVLDVIQEKLASRKLLVFITATVLMWYGLDPDTWGMIAMCYIGGQSAVDFAKSWRHGV